MSTKEFLGEIRERARQDISELKEKICENRGIIGIAVFIALWFAGGIGQSRQNYDIWLASGSAGAIKKVNWWPFIAHFKALTTLQGWQAICFVAIASLIGFIWWKYRKMDATEFFDKLFRIKLTGGSYKIAGEGTYGTATWMTDKELAGVLEQTSLYETRGTILGKRYGKVIALPERTMLNKHTAVYGASGSRKSRAFVRPYIFQAAKRGESLIITDSKGELYGDTAEWLRRQGYDVKVFNLVEPQASDSWDCLGEIGGDDMMAQVFVDVIIKNTTEENKSEGFWDKADMNLLKALSLLVSNNKNLKIEKNMAGLYDLIADEDYNLNSMFGELPNTHPARKPYQIFKQANDTVKTSVVIGLGSRLQVFQNKYIRKITSCNEINLTKPAKEKCAYFCILSDQDSTLNFLSSLFFSFLFIKLVRYADREGNGKCDVPVNFLLDEFTNIGEIPDFNKKISTVRSRNINVSIMFQNLAQLENRYPRNVWQEILGNCDTQLFLGCTDLMTAEFVSNCTGDATVEASSERRRQNPLMSSTSYDRTESTGKRKLKTPHEVRTLHRDKAFVFISGQNVLEVGKVDYTEFPQSRELIPTRAIDHVPKWRTMPQDESTEDATPPQPPVLSQSDKVVRRNDLFKRH